MPKKPRKKKKPNWISIAKLADEFKSGLTMVGLARKYGIPKIEIEKAIRLYQTWRSK